MQHPPKLRGRRHLLQAGVVLAAASLAPQLASAQPAYPSRPVTLAVSYPAGGVADLLARKVAEHLSKAWGQSVVVDNRAGGNQIVAASSVMRAAPDGHTLLLCDDGAFTLNPILFKKLPYELKDFTPIADVAEARIVLSMAKEVPASSLQEMVAYAKANPGRLNYASLGMGNTHHLLLETIQKQAGIGFTHVPMRGYPQAIQEVLANRAQLVSGGIGGPVLEHLRTGNLKALAVNGRTRSALLPGVPTFAEAGLPNVQPKVNFIIVGPAGMPAAIVDRINAAVTQAVNSEINAAVLAPNGLEPTGGRPADLERFLRAGREAYTPLVREIGITLD